jgi:hypothetical protein
MLGMCALSTYPDQTEKWISELNGQGLDPGKELHACGIRWLRHFIKPLISSNLINGLALITICL